MFSFYFIFDSPYNFYFELSFKSQIDFKRFLNFKSSMILTLNFTNAYWERTSAITIKKKKKKLNGPALSLHAVKPGTVACSVKARAHILDRVYR